MPIPLLVPVLGTLIAAAATEADSSGGPEWKIQINPDEWKSQKQKGHIRVNFEDRIIVGDTGPAPDVLSSRCVVFARFSAPFDGEEVWDWFDSHLDQMEETRGYVLDKGASEAAGLVSDFSEWLRYEAELLPGEWTFSVPDDVFDDVSASRERGFIDVDYKNRRVNAYSLVSGVRPAKLSEHQVFFARDVVDPISGEEVREWFEDRESELEEARRKQLVSRLSSFQDNFDINDFRSLLISPATMNFDINDFRPIFSSALEWLSHLSEDGGSHGLLLNLLRLDLKDVIESGSSWSIVRFDPKDLARAAVSFISDELPNELTGLIDQIDFVEGDEVLKILDEPYLFLQIRPPELDEDKEEEEEYEQDVRQLAEDMERLTKKEFISIQRDEGERQLPYVQISLPWNL